MGVGQMEAGCSCLAWQGYFIIPHQRCGKSSSPTSSARQRQSGEALETDLFSLCAARRIQVVISNGVELTRATQEQCHGPATKKKAATLLNKISVWGRLLICLLLPCFCCFIPSTPIQIFLGWVSAKAANKSIFLWCRHNWLRVYNYNYISVVEAKHSALLSALLSVPMIFMR